MAQLDHPPRNKPSRGDHFGDPVTAIVRSTGPQTVVAVLLVDEKGRVVDVIVRKASYAYFAERTRLAAMSFRFEPVTYNGRAAKWHAEMPFVFQ